MCHNGIVYARNLKGRTLTFAVSGMLWEMSLVMIDQETRSLWSHLLGRSMRGPLQGESLERIPSLITDWEKWKTRYPATTAVVMSRTATEYTRDMYQEEDDFGFLIGITDGKTSRAWRFTDLKETPVINDRFVDKGVVIAFDQSSGAAALFGRSEGARDLTFDLKDGKLIDRESGSEWDLLTGIAVTGPLKGHQLGLMDGIISLEFAWDTFYPNSTYWKSNP